MPPRFRREEIVSGSEEIVSGTFSPVDETVWAKKQHASVALGDTTVELSNRAAAKSFPVLPISLPKWYASPFPPRLTKCAGYRASFSTTSPGRSSSAPVRARYGGIVISRRLP